MSRRSEKQTGAKDGDETLEAKQGASRRKFARTVKHARKCSKDGKAKRNKQ